MPKPAKRKMIEKKNPNQQVLSKKTEERAPAGVLNRNRVFSEETFETSILIFQKSVDAFNIDRS